ncbi:hypothetical protein DFJ58DRAFT_775303, partial [Suillus subalutaceus]|uniref:uncharacterized protein n=1 Tax=Suillus subalutaceus TaxID=48586 RepID=UPI001B868017
SASKWKAKSSQACISTEQCSSGCIPLHSLYSHTTRPSSMLPQTSTTDQIRWVYFMLGCAILLPWNVLITTTLLFLSRLVKSPLRTTFASYMTTTSSVCNVFALAHATATSKQSSPSRRVFWSAASVTQHSLSFSCSSAADQEHV